MNENYQPNENGMSSAPAARPYGNSNQINVSTSMVSTAMGPVEYSYSYRTITCRDGTETYTRADCTGLMSAIIMYMGYDIRT